MAAGVADDLSDLARRSLAQAIGALRRCAEAGLSAAELALLMRTTAAQRNQLDAAFTELVGCLDGRLKYHEEPDDPANSCVGFLRDELRMTNSAAWSQVKLARQLEDLPETADAFSDGSISLQHAVVIAQAMDRIVVGRGVTHQAEPRLVGEAREHDPYDVMLTGRHLRHELNARELAMEEEDRRRRQWLHLRRRWDGDYEVTGHLDPEAGTALKVALDAEMGPKAKDDERQPAERRVEAFNKLVRGVLDSGVLPVRGGVRPHLIVTTTLDTLMGKPGSPAGELDWLWPVSSELVRRIAEDADLTPMLVDGVGNPLFAGRTRRTASRKMRLALGLRDRGCAWPGCDRPPSWCESNHQDPWRTGGKTNVNRLNSLCRRHHRKYDAGYRLKRHPDGRVEEVPPESTGSVSGMGTRSPT
jgi:hypothetical protein